ncbi:MAG: zinc-binding alcohol dehydrogenase [Chloroflexota bacterium]
MKSANIVFTGKQKAELREEAVPELPEDDLLVRTQLSLISTGTESICYRAVLEPGTHWAGWVKYPFYPGYSNVGVVEKVGSAVEGYQEGDRVFSTAQHRQYHIVKPPVTKIPDEISNESAAWSKLSTIAQTGVRRAEIAMGDKVVIIGSGPLGQNLTQYTRLMGAEEVIVVDLVESRLAVATAHGATQTFMGSAADAVPFIKEHTHGQLADIVFDATGHFAVFPLALKLVRTFGTMMLIGDSPEPGKQVLTSDVVTRQITVRGSHNERLADEREWHAGRQIELLYKYMARGQMRLDDLITHRHAPQTADDVYSGLLEDRSGTIGVAFDWSQLG